MVKFKGSVLVNAISFFGILAVFLVANNVMKEAAEREVRALLAPTNYLLAEQEPGVYCYESEDTYRFKF